jgi:ribonuclease E
VATASTAQTASTPPTEAASTTLPAVASYKLPLDSLQQVAQNSGLVWVNSDSGKVAAVQAAIAAEPAALRVPRERPPAVVVNEGPLVLVETRKDLNSLQVPF